MHQLVPKPSSIPANFPDKLTKGVVASSITVFGFSCFSKSDLIQAYDLVTEGGYIARFKDSLGSGTMKQYRLNNSSHLRNILVGYEDSYIASNGIILERNVLDPDGSSPPNSYSAGLISIFNEKYAYIGRLKLGAEGPYGYQGTHLTMAHGDLNGNISEDELYPFVSKIINDLITQISLTNEIVVGSRLNMDLIYGIYEMDNRERTLSQEPRAFINEVATYPGGATAGELSAIKYLRDHKDKHLVKFSSLTDYAANGLYERNFSRLFCDTVDSLYGRVRVGSLLTKEI